MNFYLQTRMSFTSNPNKNLSESKHHFNETNIKRTHWVHCAILNVLNEFGDENRQKLLLWFEQKRRKFMHCNKINRKIRKIRLGISRKFEFSLKIMRKYCKEKKTEWIILNETNELRLFFCQSAIFVFVVKRRFTGKCYSDASLMQSNVIFHCLRII